MNETEIKVRISLAKTLEGMLEKDPDPRAPEIKAILAGQRKELEAKLVEMGADDSVPEMRVHVEPASDGKPPAQVVRVKALTLTSSLKSQNRQEVK